MRAFTLCCWIVDLVSSRYKMKLISSVCNALTLAAVFPVLASAQGTMIFDQQSSDESNGGLTGVTIQIAQPVGQSFTPSLAEVGFVRLHLVDVNRGNNLGAILYVNLRSDSITGAVLATTAPITLPDNWGGPQTGYADFFFPTNEPVQSGTTYFFQPVVQSGDSWAMLGGAFIYSGGSSYSLGQENPAIDYWFQEGVIVPEPSSCALFLCAAIVVAVSSRQGMKIVSSGCNSHYKK